MSVTPSKREQSSEKRVSVNEFVANLAPYQPEPPLVTASEYHQRAKQMSQQGKQKQAIKDAKIAINREPYRFEHYKLLDDILIKDRDFKQIISYWDKFIRLSPEHAQAFFERFGAHYNNNNMDSAKADLKRAAELGHQEAVQRLQKLGM